MFIKINKSMFQVETLILIGNVMFFNFVMEPIAIRHYITDEIL